MYAKPKCSLTSSTFFDQFSEILKNAQDYVLREVSSKGLDKTLSYCDDVVAPFSFFKIKVTNPTPGRPNDCKTAVDFLLTNVVRWLDDGGQSAGDMLPPTADRDDCCSVAKTSHFAPTASTHESTSTIDDEPLSQTLCATEDEYQQAYAIDDLAGSTSRASTSFGMGMETLLSNTEILNQAIIIFLYTKSCVCVSVCL